MRWHPDPLINFTFFPVNIFDNRAFQSSMERSMLDLEIYNFPPSPVAPVPPWPVAVHVDEPHWSPAAPGREPPGQPGRGGHQGTSGARLIWETFPSLHTEQKIVNFWEMLSHFCDQIKNGTIKKWKCCRVESENVITFCV